MPRMKVRKLPKDSSKKGIIFIWWNISLHSINPRNPPTPTTIGIEEEKGAIKDKAEAALKGAVVMRKKLLPFLRPRALKDLIHKSS